MKVMPEPTVPHLLQALPEAAVPFSLVPVDRQPAVISGAARRISFELAQADLGDESHSDRRIALGQAVPCGRRLVLPRNPAPHRSALAVVLRGGTEYPQ